jgi:quercetin dioxygenase-like cupin family protein
MKSDRDDPDDLAALPWPGELLAGLADGLSPVTARPEVRARLLATVASADRFAPFLPALSRLFDLPAAALRAVVERIDRPGDFLVGGPGVSYLHFAPGPALSAAGAEAGIVLLEPGADFPRHRHLGTESTFVLEGVMRDGEASHGPGALVEHPAGTSHDYAATAARPLVLLVVHHGIEMADGSQLVRG